jgi:hypothetical protein
MTKLQPLKSRLSALRHRRWLLRMGTALAGALVAVLWTLSALGVIDWLVEPDRLLRVVLLAIAAGIIVWAWKRFSRPFLGQHESELEMALLVERQQHIDSDLVAALQFESPGAPQWGSAQLETAVIDYVAEYGREIDVFQGLSTDTFRRRAMLLGATVVLLAMLAAAYPAHVQVFLRRLALASDHYPTRTVIERIVLNQKTVFPAASETGGPFKAAAWEPLAFEVHCRGEIPADGRATLKAVTGGPGTQITLKAAEGRQGVFTGQVDRLVDSIDYQLYLGDAWTDPARVEVIPLPVVDVTLVVTPPEYAAQPEAEESPPGARQVSVVEGSRVAVRVVSDKRLESAKLSVLEAQYPLERTSLAAAEVRDTWQLDQPSTPLAQVMEPLRYEVQVVDRDGLSLRTPIQGFIRIKADRPPRVTAAMITQHVLPTGRPTISYGAADDYGIAQLRVRRQVSRQDGRMSEDTQEVPLSGTREKLLRGKFPLELSSLKLAKGDQLRVTFEAVDFRGALPGKSALSEPLILQITDERGVLAAMVEADERSARQLDAIIQRQLGIGDSP